MCLAKPALPSLALLSLALPLPALPCLPYLAGTYRSTPVHTGTCPDSPRLACHTVPCQNSPQPDAPELGVTRPNAPALPSLITTVRDPTRPETLEKKETIPIDTVSPPPPCGLFI